MTRRTLLAILSGALTGIATGTGLARKVYGPMTIRRSVRDGHRRRA